MREDGKMAGKAAAAAEIVETREDAAASALLDVIATSREIARARGYSQDRMMLGEAKMFAWAAGRLLRTADQVLAETRQGRKETADLLERLEARLASHG